MPRIINSRLDPLVTVGLETTLRVTYTAVFTPLDRHLAALGLQLQRSAAMSSANLAEWQLRSFPCCSISALAMPR